MSATLLLQRWIGYRITDTSLGGRDRDLLYRAAEAGLADIASSRDPEWPCEIGDIALYQAAETARHAGRTEDAERHFRRALTEATIRDGFAVGRIFVEADFANLMIVKYCQLRKPKVVTYWLNVYLANMEIIGRTRPTNGAQLAVYVPIIEAFGPAAVEEFGDRIRVEADSFSATLPDEPDDDDLKCAMALAHIAHFFGDRKMSALARTVLDHFLAQQCTPVREAAIRRGRIMCVVSEDGLGLLKPEVQRLTYLQDLEMASTDTAAAIEFERLLGDAAKDAARIAAAFNDPVVAIDCAEMGRLRFLQRL